MCAEWGGVGCGRGWLWGVAGCGWGVGGADLQVPLDAQGGGILRPQPLAPAQVGSRGRRGRVA
eukprot:12209360-Prorocentrum_lima.AAC.1